MKVPVRKLRIYPTRALNRYLLLKDAVLEGVISDLKIEHYNAEVCGFSYRIVWNGEYVPTGIPLKTIQCWRSIAAKRGLSERVFEPTLRNM